MNERIKELKRQAQQYADENYSGSFVKYDPNWFDFYNEKFAELIVRECARIARVTPCPYTDELMRQQLGHTWDMASSAAGREITEHFGVEE